MRHLLHGLVLALLLATAGCNIGIPSGATPEPTGTFTPAPTASPVPEYPPGIGPSGVTDPFALADAHATVLGGSSYTVVRTRTLRAANGTRLVNETERIRIGTAPGRYHYRLDASGTGLPRFHWGTTGTSVIHANGTVAARKLVDPSGEVEYRAFRHPDGTADDPAAIFHGAPLNKNRIAVLFDRAGASVSNRGDAFRLRASAFEAESLSFTVYTVENLSVTSFTATVTRAGLVRSYELAFEGTVDGHRVSGVERVRYGAVGRTTVEEPAWFANAVDE